MMDLPATPPARLIERDVVAVISPAIQGGYKPPEIPQSAVSGSSPIDVVVSFSITQRPSFETISPSRPSLAASQLDVLRESAFAELNRYALYERGWDGYDGESFGLGVLTLARALIENGAALLQTQNISPTEITTGPASDGSLDVEFVAGGKRLIITLDPTAIRHAIYAEYDGWSHSEADDTDLACLVRWISWVAGPPYLPAPVGAASASS